MLPLILGPYIYQSFRTEHLLLLFLFLRSLFWGYSQLSALAAPLVFLFFSLLFSLYSFVLGTFEKSDIFLGITTRSRSDFLNGFENFIIFPVYILVLISLFSYLDFERTLEFLSKQFLAFLNVNCFFAFYQSQNDNLNVFFKQFWIPQNSNALKSVAELAATNGRFMGIFNQPTEAGFAYSVGLLLTIYLFNARLMKPKWVLVTTLLIFSGGILSSSKVFLFLGIPISFFFFFLINREKSIFFISVSTILLIFLLSTSTINTRVQRLDLISTLFSSDFDRLNVLTAGRWGNEGSLSMITQEVLSSSPVVGLGITFFGTYSDSDFLRVFASSGLLGLVSILLAIMLLFLTLNVRVASRNPIALLGKMILLIVFLGSFGGNPISGNRVAGLISVFVVVISLYCCQEKTNKN